MTSAAAPGPPPRAGYPRSTGSRRGQARREQLLELVTDDLGKNGLVDFSLRRAARSAGTSHKVLLYHFDGVEDLLLQGVLRLRERRIDGGLAAAGTLADHRLSARVRALWPILTGPESWVLDQAIGLAIFDQARYAQLAHDATKGYIPALMSLCPATWSETRQHEVSELVLGTLRGFLVDLRTNNDVSGIQAGFEALARALDREQAAGS